MNKAIDLYKNFRSNRFLSQKYIEKYAFVGIGNHSINNLYPVLQYLNISLKYIVCRSPEKAKLISGKYNGVIGTHDYEIVLKDPEISGIFISAAPESHYSLIKQALIHNKKVFVEKPPCTTLSQLDELISIREEMSGVCLVGMQKRYSPCINIVKKKIIKKNIISYSYKYVTGLYNGNEILDLFIHPLDTLCYIFGNFEILSVHHTNKYRKNSGNTIFINLRHGSIIGNIELSTNYSWKSAQETLQIVQDSGIYTMDNCDTLSYKQKQRSFFSIPVEKVFPANSDETILFNRNNFVPIMSNNQIYTQGYYSEILTFVNLVENKKAANVSSLENLKLTYKLLEAIQGATKKM